MNRTPLLALTASLLAGTTAVANPNCPGCWPAGAAVTNLLNPADFPNSGYNPFVPAFGVYGPGGAGGEAIAQQFTTGATTFRKIYAGLWNVSGPNNNTYLSIFYDDGSGTKPGSPVTGCLMRLVNAPGGAVVPVNTFGSYAVAKCLPGASVAAGTYWVVASAKTTTQDLWLPNVGDMATPEPFVYSTVFNSGGGGSHWFHLTPADGAVSYAVR